MGCTGFARAIIDAAPLVMFGRMGIQPAVLSLLPALFATALAGRRWGHALIGLGILGDIGCRCLFCWRGAWPEFAAQETMFLLIGVALVQAMSVAIERNRRLAVLSATQCCSHCILLVDEQSKVVFANEAAVRLLRVPIDKMRGRNLDSLLPGCTNEASYSGPAIARDGAGNDLQVDVLSTTLGTKRLLLLRDIAAWRLALPDDQTEERLRLVLETIPAMVYSRTPDGSVDYANHRSTEFFGMTIQQICEGGWVEALHPEEKDEVLARINANFRKGEPYQMEYRRRRFDGEYRWFNTAVQPLKTPDGKTIRWYGVLTDVHEHRLAEASLRLSQLHLSEATQKLAIAEFSASVVHELSQPLTAMVVNSQACLEWLCSDTQNVTEAKLAAERVLRNGKDARTIIAGLRELFRNRTSQMCPFSLPETYGEVISILRGRLDKEGVQMILSVPHDLPPVLGDRLQIQQVLFNLLNNAVDAMRDSTHLRLLRIRSRALDGYVVTEVEDRGAGVSEPERIFDAFYTTKTDGMGMGLSICKSIIEAHKGQLWCSKAAPRGTIFSFTIPVSNGGGT